MKTLFDIGTDVTREETHTLLLEIGSDHCYTALFHKPSNTIDRIQLHALDEFAIEEEVRNLLEPFKQAGLRNVVICSAFPQALLVPKKFFTNGYVALSLVYDQPAQAYSHDTIPEWQMVNAYSFPKPLFDFIKDSFANVYCFHAYTPTIKIYNGYVADQQLLVHFSQTSFRVLLKADANIHLAQTYSYKTPHDVAYYLLKICYEFQISQQHVYLILSGLIEKASNLYDELRQYFTHIHFAQQPEISLPQSPHPHYYFTSIYNLAACVL